MNHYQNLGLPNNASKNTVKKTYRKLAKEYHPDRNKKAGASDRFIAINNSYEYIMSGKGDHSLNTYKYYAKEASKPKGKPVNEFDLDGDGKLSAEEYRAMKKHKLEEAARAFYNQHETSTSFKNQLLFYYAFHTFLAVFSIFFIIMIRSQLGIAGIFLILLLVYLSITILNFFFNYEQKTKQHQVYIKIIRKFYDPKFKILGFFWF